MPDSTTEHPLSVIEISLDAPATERPRSAQGERLILFIAAFTAFSSLYCTQALWPELRDHFGATEVGAGALLTATTLGVALASPFASRAVGHFGVRRSLVASLFALALLTMLMAFAPGMATLLVLRALQGLLIPVALNALLSTIGLLWVGVGVAAVASASYTIGTVLGGLVGRFLPSLVATGHGWSAAFVTFALLQLLLAAAVARWFPDPGRARPPTTVLARQWVVDLLWLWRTPLLAPFLAGGALLFTQAAVTTFIAVRLSADPFYWSTAALGALYATFLPSLVFIPLTPRLIVRFGVQRLAGGIIAAAWLGLTLTLPASPPAIVLGLTVFSAAVFVGQTLLASAVSQATRAGREGASGQYLLAYYLGGSAGSLVPSFIWPAYGWLGCLVLVGAAQVIVAVAIYLFFTRRRHATQFDLHL